MDTQNIDPEDFKTLMTDLRQWIDSDRDKIQTLELRVKVLSDALENCAKVLAAADMGFAARAARSAIQSTYA